MDRKAKLEVKTVTMKLDPNVVQRAVISAILTMHPNATVAPGTRWRLLIDLIVGRVVEGLEMDLHGA